MDDLRAPAPPPARPQPPAPADDRVLSCLTEAEAGYRQFRAAWEQQTTVLDSTRASLASEQELSRRLTADLEEARRQLLEERANAVAQQKRAGDLDAMLQQIHRALFSGNVYDLILKACLSLTGATRGLYITVRASNEGYLVRSALGVDGYPLAPPSPFLKELCRRALETRESQVYRKGEMSRLPPPDRPGETFEDCIVAPVALLQNLNGTVIVADKAHGDFERTDVELLLSIGSQASVAVENVGLRRKLQNA